MTLLAALLLTLAPPAQTTVTAAESDAHVVVPQDGMVDPSSALAALPGVVLQRDGGPLSPSHVTLRGLGGARVQASLLGLPLADPMDGLFDAEALPWFSLRVLAADPLRRQLRFEPDRRGSRLRAGVGVGGLSTVRVGSSASMQTEHGQLLVGAEAGSTRGDFAFLAPSQSGAGTAQPLVRSNNDQRRLNALVLSDETRGALRVQVAALGSWHEGGVPGFATHPTAGLRGEDLRGAIGGVIETDVGPWVATGSAQVTGAQQRSHSDPAAAGAPADGAAAEGAARSGVASTGLRSGVGVRGEGGDARASLEVHAARADVFPALFVRQLAGASAAVAFQLPWDLALEAMAAAELLSDVGPLGSARLGLWRTLVLGGADCRVGVAASRAARAPTLDELYAPRGFVRGNAALQAEALDDVELRLGVRAGSTLRMEAAAWGGRVEDAILYLNANAFEVRPENTGGALRAGFDTFVSVEPSRLAGLSVTGSVLASRLDATGATLPLAPGFSSRVQARLGDATAAHVGAVLWSRSASSASLYGTPQVPGYSLVDLMSSFPLGPALTLGVQLKNALDVQDARDQNGLPLPGRFWFVSIGVSA